MDLKDLELLVALAEHRHFARAARASNLSQPAFSTRIRKLEDALGVPLVNRGVRFSSFTPAGAILLDGARRLLAEWRGVVEEVEAARANLTGRIVLGVVPSALETVGHLIEPFRARHPNVRIAVFSLTSDRIGERLDEFSLDVGVTYLAPAPHQTTSGHIALPLYVEDYALVGRDLEARDLGGTDPIAWEAAARRPLALLSRGMQFRRVIDRGLGPLDADPPFEADTFTALLAEVRAGPLATIVPAVLAANARALGLEARPLAPLDPPETIALVAVDREPLPPTVAGLIAAARGADWRRLSGDPQ